MKESRMLQKAGHKLWFFSLANPQLSVDVKLEDIFINSTGYKDAKSLGLFLRGLDFIDIVHVHNEPSFLVNIVKEAGHSKVILDAHDLDIVRNGWDNLSSRGQEDVNALAVADGLIVPCDNYIKIIEERGKLHIPYMTLFSYTNEEDLVEEPHEYLGGIVYEGSIYAPSPNHPAPYRLYHNVAKEIIKNLIPFFIYPGGGYTNQMLYYASLGCNIMPSADPGTLLKNLSRHGWGFCGSPIDHRQWDNTLSNKLFDYIAAGIPSFIYKAKATEEAFGDKGVGIVIKDLSEIPKYYNDKKLRQELVDNIMKVRKQWVMEAQLEALEGLYSAVLNGGVNEQENKEVVGGTI
jgi:hypothetical protein